MKLRVKMEFENKLEQGLFKAEMEYMRALVLNDIYSQCRTFKTGLLGRINLDKQRTIDGIQFLENNNDQLFGYDFTGTAGLNTQMDIFVHPVLFEIVKLGSNQLVGRMVNDFLVKMGVSKWTPEAFERKLRADLAENYKGRKFTIEQIVGTTAE